MPGADFKSMSIEELWALYQDITGYLERSLLREISKLDRFLCRIHRSDGNTARMRQVRRSYPELLPRYQDPRNPTERWSGLGKQSRLVKTQLNAGKELEEPKCAASDTLHRKRRR